MRRRRITTAADSRRPNRGHRSGTWRTAITRKMPTNERAAFVSTRGSKSAGGGCRGCSILTRPPLDAGSPVAATATFLRGPCARECAPKGAAGRAFASVERRPLACLTRALLQLRPSSPSRFDCAQGGVRRACAQGRTKGAALQRTVAILATLGVPECYSPTERGRACRAQTRAAAPAQGRPRASRSGTRCWPPPLYAARRTTHPPRPSRPSHPARAAPARGERRAAARRAGVGETRRRRCARGAGAGAGGGGPRPGASGDVRCAIGASPMCGPSRTDARRTREGPGRVREDRARGWRTKYT
eukprot:scaffold1465_cov383-Prasinococcus_capsulatus_cf.AAC.16